MKKIDRRTFLRRAGLLSAGLAAGIRPRLFAASPSAENTNAKDTPPAAAGEAVEEDENTYRIEPIDHGRALVNPGMGWTMHFYSNILANYGSGLAPSDTVDDFPGLGAVYLRVPWAFLEPEEGCFVWELLDTPAQRWIDKGRQVAFRVTATESWLYHATPQWVFDAGARGYDVKGQYIEPEYDDPVFLEKTENFLRAMAERYDRNPHVAFIDVGHFGMWGEGHTVMSTPEHGHEWGVETQKRFIDLYRKHFRDTQLCISDDFAGHDRPGERFPITDYAFSQGVTIRDDSILVQPPPRSWYHSEMAQLFWPTLPVILEHEHYGGSKQRGAWSGELLEKSVEEYHASFMSIHWEPRVLLEENRGTIDRINRRMGYRLRMDSARWPRRVAMGERFSIRSEWSNAGVAPCYAGGYPCFTLKDEKGGIVSVLVADDFDLKNLTVGPPDQAPGHTLESSFRIAPRYEDRAGTFYRACRPGIYDLYVSVGQKDGTPLYALPYEGDDSKRRYRLGRIEITE